MNDRAKPKILQIRKMQEKDRKGNAVAKIIKVLGGKRKCQTKMHRRKNERISLQSSCMQSMQRSDLSFLQTTIRRDGLNDTLKISDFYNFKVRGLNDWANPH